MGASIHQKGRVCINRQTTKRKPLNIKLTGQIDGTVVSCVGRQMDESVARPGKSNLDTLARVIPGCRSCDTQFRPPTASRLLLEILTNIFHNRFFSLSLSLSLDAVPIVSSHFFDDNPMANYFKSVQCDLFITNYLLTQFNRNKYVKVCFN